MEIRVSRGKIRQESLGLQLWKVSMVSGFILLWNVNIYIRGDRFLQILLFSCWVLSDSLWPMDGSMTGFPVLHYLLELSPTHVHWVGDVIQPSHLLSPPSPPDLNLSQHQGLLQWVGSLHQVAKGLELQLQHQSFQWIFWFNFLYDWLDWSPCLPRDSQLYDNLKSILKNHCKDPQFCFNSEG